MKLTVLHISDIHFKTSKDSIIPLAEDIAMSAFSDARGSDACLIAVTGDIAFSGAEDEYEIAIQFIKKIEDKISKETGLPVYVIAVPGNHDCVLKPVDEIRELVIEKIVAEPALASNQKFISQCVQAQENYFKFRKKLSELNPVFDSAQWTEYSLALSGQTIRVSALNAAWMSRLPEMPGSLAFPLDEYEQHLSVPSDLRLVLIHQPFNWQQQRSYHEMRAQLCRKAIAVLSGHEHLGNSGTMEDEVSGQSLYFEAGALQPDELNATAGYAIYQFDMAVRQVVIRRFAIASSSITENEDTVIYEYASASEKDTKVIELNPEWLKEINNPGGYFTHSDKRELVLDDIFIYPDLRDKQNSTSGRFSSVSSEKLIANMKAGAKCLIVGEEKSGKSTLLHFYIKQLISDGYAPVYIQANEMNNIRKKEDVALRINRFIAKQYVNRDAIEKLPRAKKVILIDDIDRFKSGIGAIPSLLQYAEEHYGGILLTANRTFEVTTLASKNVTEAFKVFSKYEIQRFGLLLRHRMIKKWCSLGEMTSLAELDRRIDVAENTMNLVIGQNLVPQLPIYLLILLQSCDQHQQGEIQNSGFSHYYQFLITKSLGQVGVTPVELNEHYNYLSHLTWFMQQRGTKELELQDLRIFNKEFSDKYTSIDLLTRLSLLVNARILFKRGEFYSFAYPYVFYFFIGKYLSIKYKDDSVVKQWIVDACSKLYLRDNANAILFLTHHDDSTWIIEKIADVMRGCFHGKAPMELDGDTVTINALVSTASQLLLAAPDVSKNQEDLRELNDEYQREESDLPDATPDKDGELAFIPKITLLFKTAEILGQILKNYYGSLEKPLKAQLLKEVFDGPLRALRLLLEEIAVDMEGFVSYIDNIVFKDDNVLPAETRAKLGRKAAFDFLGGLGVSVISASAYYISTDKLREDVTSLVHGNPTIAYRLISIGTRLVRPGRLPLAEIDQLAKELKHNHYAFGILQSLGVHHLYQFHTEVSDKDKLCSSLNISVQDVKALEIFGRDTKLVSVT